MWQQHTLYPFFGREDSFDGEVALQPVRPSWINELIASLSRPWAWIICRNRWFSEVSRSFSLQTFCAAVCTSFVACMPRSRAPASLRSRSATYSFWR